MAVTNGYTTVADVRDHLGDTGSKLDLTLLERAINSASRAVDNYCSGGRPRWRRFWPDTVASARTFRVDDSRVAWIDDLWDASSVVIKTDDDDDGTYETTWDTTDFQLEPLNGGSSDGVPYAFYLITALNQRLGLLTTRQFNRVESRAALQVTAKWGWSATPDEVQLATILLAVKLFKRKDAPFGVAGMNDFGAVRITQADPDVKTLLDPYVKLRSRGLSFSPQQNSIFHQRWS